MILLRRLKSLTIALPIVFGVACEGRISDDSPARLVDVAGSPAAPTDELTPSGSSSSQSVGSNRSESSYTIRDSATARIVENRAPTRADPWIIQWEPEIRIGSASQGQPYDLYRVTGAVRLSDGRIVIGNGSTYELRYFGSDGRFLMSAGRDGSGPGEFQMLHNIFALPGDSLAASDLIQRRLAIFDPQGVFARQVSFELRSASASPFARLPDGSYLMELAGWAIADRPPTRIERMPAQIFRLTESDRVPRPITSLPGLETIVAPGSTLRPDGTLTYARGPRFFGRNTFIEATAAGWVIGDNDRPELLYHSLDGELIAIARWPHTPRPITAADLEAEWVARIDERDRDDPAIAARLRQSYEGYPPPPATMPAFANLYSDSEGYVWLKEYSPFAEPDPNRFRVFDADGVWITTVIVPEGLRLLSIGRDYVLGWTSDELGVESVVMHRLERG